MFYCVLLYRTNRKKTTFFVRFKEVFILQRILKIIFILFIIFSFCVSYIYATDIDLNLPANNTVADENTQNDETNTVDDNSVDTSEQDSLPGDDVSSGSDTLPTSNILETQTMQPSAVTTVQNSGLGVTGIINILLITVGIVIILLAIAIIIRLKN